MRVLGCEDIRQAVAMHTGAGRCGHRRFVYAV